MKLFSIIDTTFENFDNTIKSYLTKALGSIGQEYSPSQIYAVIFNGIKGVMQNMLFYIEDALTEQNIFTATRKKSVYSLAKISGYDPYYGSGASGKLIGKLNINNVLPSKTTKLYIYNHTKVVNKITGLTYSIILPTDYYSFDISQPLLTHEFKIVQGLFINSSYVATGAQLETIHISANQLIDNEYISVKVNGVEWTQVGNLYDMTENGQEYVYQTGYDNAFDIIFGDGIFGRKLSNGDTVIVTYLGHAGTLGNINPNKTSRFIFSGYGYDSLGNNINLNDYMDLFLDTCISGGTNSDSIEFIRQMVGKNSRSLVFANEDNFKLFFKRFSFIGYCNCWTNTNSMEVIVTCLKNIKNEVTTANEYFSIIQAENMLLSDDQKLMIQNTLENSRRSFGGIKLRFQDPIIRKYAIICYVKSENIYDQDVIKTQIIENLVKYFLDLQEDTLFIAKSSIITYLLTNVDNILSLDIDIISELAEEAYKNGKYKKYVQRYINGQYLLDTVDVIYEENTYPGLDSFGNISLNSKIEIPILGGNFKYYTDKDNMNKISSVRIPPIQVFFS